MNARVIIADDHLVVRQGLRGILQSKPGIEVVAEAVDGIAAEELARNVAADLLILDISLPLRRGIAVCERLRTDCIQLPILFFSMYPQSQYSAAVRKIGAQGFLGKESPADAILTAVHRVLSGHTAFSGRARADKSQAHPSDTFSRLSKRELEVLRGLVAGQSLMNLARTMGLNNKTLSTYRARVLTKLAVNSNAELVALAIQHGLQ